MEKVLPVMTMRQTEDFISLKVFLTEMHRDDDAYFHYWKDGSWTFRYKDSDEDVEVSDGHWLVTDLCSLARELLDAKR